MVAKDGARQRSSSIIETTSTESIESGFAWKIHAVLDESERQGFEDVISWQGDKTFTIRDPKQFEQSVMRDYFNQHNYKCFQRQLQIHGFERVAIGDAIGASYTHQLLIRGKPNMCRFMVRTKSKKKTRRRSSSPAMRSIYAEMPSTMSTTRRSSVRRRRIPSSLFRSTSGNCLIPSCVVPELNHRPKVRSLENKQNSGWNAAKSGSEKVSNRIGVETNESAVGFGPAIPFGAPQNNPGIGTGLFASPFPRTELAMPFANHRSTGTTTTTTTRSSCCNSNSNINININININNIENNSTNRSRSTIGYHGHNRSHSSPSALTASFSSPGIETLRLDRDLREEPPAGGKHQHFCDAVRTIDASLSVLCLATRQQQP